MSNIQDLKQSAIYMIPATMDSIGRILIPAPIRNKTGLSSESNLVAYITADGKVLIEPVIAPAS